MHKSSKKNPNLLRDTAFRLIRPTKIEQSFKNLLAVGEKIENFTQQIKAEIHSQTDKTELGFLQRLKPKIGKLARLYQEELACIEAIKHHEVERADDIFPPPLSVPLFILEERTWKKFGLENPWAQLKLQGQTLIELAIEQEMEQHGTSVSYEEKQLKKQLMSWKEELSLLGISVQYKTNAKLNQREFEKLLTQFSAENQPDTEFGLDLSLGQVQIQKSSEPLKPLVDINVKEEIAKLTTVLTEDSDSVDKFLQEMESLSQQSHEMDEMPLNLEDAVNEFERKPKRGEKKPLTNINLASVNQELDELLSNPKANANQTKPVTGYLKRLFTGTLGEEELKPNEEELVFEVMAEKLTTEQRHLLQIEQEIDSSIASLDAVINGSTSCDGRLLEYLRIKSKAIARLLVEKDFLVQNQAIENQQALADYVDANLPAKQTELLTELLEPTKETLLENIDKENQEIRAYNRKYKKNKPMKELNEFEWKQFCKKLLS